MKRTITFAAVALIAVVALVLGSFGSATAASLTKAQVKKIAAKVVTAKAPSLSVAKAASATKADTAATATTATTAATAATLGGKTAAQLGTNATRYVLPVQAPAFTRSYTFPGLASGTYLVSYNLTATMSTPGDIPICQMRASGSAANEVTAYGGVFSGCARTQATGITAVTATSRLECNSSGGGFTITDPGDSISAITFIPIDSLADSGAATSARGAGTRTGSGSGN